MMTQRIRSFTTGLVFAIGLATPLAAQVVINPAPVPSCSNGQTLIYNSGTWACGSTTGTGTWVGSGTTGKIPKATGAQQLGDSIMAESGTTITVTGTLNATAALHLNGSSINTAGVLTNVAYLNQSNNFSVKQFINGTTNSRQTLGLTIDQGANDNEAFSLKSADVAHGVTGETETDTFFAVMKASAADGGALLYAFTETTNAFQAAGVGVTDDTATSTSARGYVEFVAAKKSGTSVTDPGSTANMVVIRTGANGLARFLFKADGSAYADVTWTTFDTHDDLALLRSLEWHATPQDNPFRAKWALPNYSTDDLRKAGIAHVDTKTGTAMVNLTRMPMLLSGAIRQTADRVDVQGGRLEVLEAEVARLTALVFGRQP